MELDANEIQARAIELGKEATEVLTRETEPFRQEQLEIAADLLDFYRKSANIQFDVADFNGQTVNGEGALEIYRLAALAHIKLAEACPR